MTNISNEASKIAKIAGGLHQTLADTIGNPNKVWCKHCGRSQSVDATHCLRHGWPQCCKGHTMTIDQP